MSYIPVALRKQLVKADGSQCAYCQTTVENSGQRLTVASIRPQSQGGMTTFDNLCLACQQCNEFKGSTTTGNDPLTGEMVALFHPRTQQWHEHFAWNASGTRIVGLTATGRSTIIALKMNNEIIVKTRRRWISAGWHPPK
jgi:hypothetical protein